MIRLLVTLLEAVIITSVPLAVSWLANRYERKHSVTARDRTRKSILDAIEVAILEKLNRR